MMTIMLLPFIQRKEEEIKETSAINLKTRRRHKLQAMIIENVDDYICVRHPPGHRLSELA
jgi:hypothetical protein